MDRREFLGGAWLGRHADEQASAGKVDTVNLLVHARREQLVKVERQIAAVDGVTIRHRNPHGRLDIAVAAADSASVGAALSAIAAIPGVLNVLAAPGMPT